MKWSVLIALFCCVLALGGYQVNYAIEQAYCLSGSLESSKT